MLTERESLSSSSEVHVWPAATEGLAETWGRSQTLQRAFGLSTTGRQPASPGPLWPKTSSLQPQVANNPLCPQLRLE
eukprot:scaffold24684_cov31-Prasinocladus_malaysianus.AAC.1